MEEWICEDDEEAAPEDDAAPHTGACEEMSAFGSGDHTSDFTESAVFRSGDRDRGRAYGLLTIAGS